VGIPGGNMRTHKPCYFARAFATERQREKGMSVVNLLPCIAAVVVEGDQALLEPPGADTETTGATELIGHRAGDAVAACGGIGVPRPFRRRDERFVLRSEAIDEGEG